jgi:hypothetical protein
MLNMLLFFYAPVMLGALLWNTIACLLVFRRRQVVSWRFRYVHYLAMLLMLPGCAGPASFGPFDIDPKP